MPPYVQNAPHRRHNGAGLRGRLPRHGGMNGRRIQLRCREGDGAPGACTAYAFSFSEGSLEPCGIRKSAPRKEHALRHGDFREPRPGANRSTPHAAGISGGLVRNRASVRRGSHIRILFQDTKARNEPGFIPGGIPLSPCVADERTRGQESLHTAPGCENPARESSGRIRISCGRCTWCGGARVRDGCRARRGILRRA